MSIKKYRCTSKIFSAIDFSIQPRHIIIIITINLYNITLSRRRRRPTTLCNNNTLGNTPFQLISDFFNFMLIKVFSVMSMLSKLPPPGVLEGGGGQQAC